MGRGDARVTGNMFVAVLGKEAGREGGGGVYHQTMIKLSMCATSTRAPLNHACYLVNLVTCGKREADKHETGQTQPPR